MVTCAPQAEPHLVDVLVSVFLGIAVLYLISQEVRPSWPPLPGGVGILAAAILVLIVGLDWFVGRRVILGHPRGFLHETLKIGLAFLLVSFIASGVRAVFEAVRRGLLATLFPVIWSTLLLVLVLKFLGAW